DFSNFGLGGHANNGFASDLHALFGHGEDVDRSVVFDVDFATGFLDKFLDVLAAGADQRANLLRVDLYGFNAWRILAQFLAWSGQSFRHFAKDVHARDPCLLNGVGHEGMRDSTQLEIELKAGDAFFRSGDFAIHIAECVFPADDIGEEL